jgi:Flp pilus assembly protein TadG
MELVLATPLLLLLLGLIVQAGVTMHAHHVAQSAAARALEAARADGGSVVAGAAAGRQSLAVLAPNILTDPQVTVTRTATQVRVEVSGYSTAVVPGVRLRVVAVAVGPVERFVPATDRGLQ